MVDVEQWAEVRRMHRVEGSSGREISRRTGLTGTRSRGCWRRASRRSTSGRRRGRSLSVQGLDCEQFRLIRGSSRSGCGRRRARSAMRAGSRSSTTTFGRFGRGSWSPGRSSGRSTAGRAGAVRIPGTEGAGSGRARAAAPRVGGDVRGVLVARDRGYADFQQGGAGHPLVNRPGVRGDFWPWKIKDGVHAERSDSWEADDASVFA